MGTTFCIQRCSCGRSCCIRAEKRSSWSEETIVSENDSYTPPVSSVEEVLMRRQFDVQYSEAEDDIELTSPRSYIDESELSPRSISFRSTNSRSRKKKKKTRKSLDSIEKGSNDFSENFLDEKENPGNYDERFDTRIPASSAASSMKDSYSSYQFSIRSLHGSEIDFEE